MVFEIIWDFIKYFLIIAGWFIGYKLYEFLFIPWNLRRKYSKYPNVNMAKKFYPFLGDIAEIVEYQKQNKFILYNSIETVIENPNYDIKLVQFGPDTTFDMLTVKALKEFESLIPNKIDRFDHKNFPADNISPNSFGVARSNKDWDIRRKTILKTMGINFASQYIPMMMKTVDDWSKEVKFNVSLDLSKEMGIITFRIITKILFGNDIDMLGKVKYISPSDHKEEHLILEEFYSKISRDQFIAYLSPKGKIFSFLTKYNLVEPYKSNVRNITNLINSLREFVKLSSDKESVYHKIMSLKVIDAETVLKDTAFLLFAGFDTTSKSICSTLYLLKKHPEVLAKLKSSLDSAGILKLNIDDETKLKTIFEECDYLTYVVKESLRIDPAIVSGLLYTALDDVTIWGVPFEKGTKFTISSLVPQFNPNDWKDPTKFIPERFDPENEEYSYRPGGKKEARDPKSYIPFSFGLRNCAGQTLAKVELKVIVWRILTVVDFEIDKDQIENDYAKFNLFSQMQLSGKVTRRHLD